MLGYVVPVNTTIILHCITVCVFYFFASLVLFVIVLIVPSPP